jgi:hypothetical protein
MNTLARKDYRGQLNNELCPKVACNVTHMIMNLFQAGWGKEVRAAVKDWERKTDRIFLQEEDALMSFILQEKYRKDAQARLGDKYYNAPYEVWQTLMQATNDFIGIPIVRIDWTITLDGIQDHITSGDGVGVSGDFPGTAGHFVNMGWIGDDYEIINDPYGDHTAGYKKGQSGYGVKMTRQEFRDIIKCANRAKYPGTYLAFIVRAKED